MKKILTFLLVFIFCISLSGCKEEEKVLNIDAVLHHTEDGIFTSRQQVAYYKVFFETIKKKPTYLEDMKYLVLNIDNIGLKETKYLEDLFGTFAKEQDLTLFSDKKESLEERKHINNGKYDNGIILTYNDIEYSDKKIVTELEIWHSEDINEKNIYTVEKISDEWVITKMEGVN